MKKFSILLLGLFLAPGVFAADLDKAKAEGQANLYANITAIEPIIEEFTTSQGVKGVYTRISTSTRGGVPQP